jgi:hypothetical protein
VPWAVKKATSVSLASRNGCIITGFTTGNSFLGRDWQRLLIMFFTPRLLLLPLLRIRSRVSWETKLTVLISCKLGASSDISCTTGNWMNSIGKALGSPSKETASAVIAADVLVDPVDPALFALSGHSALQCPFRPQFLQVLSMMRC